MTLTPLTANFRRLQMSNAASNLADGVAWTALPLLAAAITRDPAQVAGLATAQSLPWFLFSYLSGTLVDRLNRRDVLRYANFIRMGLFVLLAALVWGGAAPLWLLYVIAFVHGTVETFFDNAVFAVVPAIVAQPSLERANSQLFVTQTTTNQFIGPPIGGFLFAAVNALPFGLSGLLFGAAALTVGGLQGQFQQPEDAPRSSLMVAMREGLAWYWNHRLLRTMSFMAGALNLASSMTGATFVLYAQDILGVDDRGYGLLLTTAAVGGVLGGALATRVIARLGAGQTLFVTNVAFGLAYVFIALFNHPLTTALGFVLLGFNGMVGNVVVISLRQSIIPDALLGRVTSAYRLVAVGASPLGALLGGYIARWFGLVSPYWIAGLLTVVVSVVILPIVNNRTIAAAREAFRNS